MIINTIHNKKVMKEAIKKNGKFRQSVIAMEECSELIKAISKMIRYSYNEDLENVYRKGYLRDDLIEEMADVYIILDELKIMYDILEFDIEEIIKRKIDREEGRINYGFCGERTTERNDQFRPEGTD